MSVNDSLLVIVLAQAVLYGTPLLYAALGELLAERSGVLNLGVEGMMLFGAVVGFWITQRVHGSAPEVLFLAVLAAAIAGAALAAIHAFLVITLRANQIVSGLALTFLGTGLARVLGEGVSDARNTALIPQVTIPVLSEIPIIGDIFFTEQRAVAEPRVDPVEVDAIGE